MNDPLTEIENRKAQLDIGATAYRLFKGARDDGASFREAFAIMFAWFKASINPNVEE